jgi:Methyltransferase domain
LVVIGARPERSRRILAPLTTNPSALPYDDLAAAYDERVLERTKLVAELLCTNSLISLTRVLDLGIGTGLVWAHISSVHGLASVVGVDVSRGMLALARQRQIPILQLVRADFADLPFVFESFDSILLSFSARHARDLIHTLQDSRGVLAKHGRVVMIEYDSETQMRLAPAVMRCYSLLGHIGGTAPEAEPSFFAACPVDDLLWSAEQAGFETDAVEKHVVVEAEGPADVVTFLMNSPPVAFDLVRCSAEIRDDIRRQLISDCHRGLMPDRIASRIVFCVMHSAEEGYK